MGVSPGVHSRSRLVRSAIGIGGLIVAAVVDHYVTHFLDAQEKAGHDIGTLGHLLLMAPQFWFVATAFVILMIWCLEPWVHRTPPDSVLNDTQGDAQYLISKANQEASLARSARESAERDLKVTSERLREALRKLERAGESALAQQVLELKQSRQAAWDELQRTKDLLARHRYSTGIITDVQNLPEDAR